MQTLEFGVENMSCESCAKTIVKKLSELEGVADVKADPDKKHVRIEFDNHKVCDSDITCAVEALGYRVHTV